MKKILMIFGFVFGALAVPTMVHAESLRVAIQSALTNNPKIDAAQASLRATEFVLKQSQGRFFPEVDVFGDYGQEKIDRPEGIGPLVNNTWRKRKQAGVSIRQVLFDGFDRINDVYRSQARISASSFKVIARSELLGLAVTEAYIDVVRHQNLMHLAQNNVKRHISLLNLIRERYEGGKAPIGDVEKTIERVESAKALVAQIMIALDTSRAKYRNAVGDAPGVLQQVRQAPGLPRTANEAIQTALTNNPRIQAAAAEIDVANFDKKQYRSSLFPQVSVVGNASHGENLGGTPGRNEEMSAMVVLTWKLFDGGVRWNRDLELAERHSEKIAEQKILAREIVQEIEIAWSRFVHGQTQVTALKKQVRQNQKVLATYKDEYNANKRNLLDLLDAENANFGSQFTLSNARALYLFASYQILAQSGILLSKLNIETPYDFDVLESSNSIKGLYKAGGQDFLIPPLR